MSKYSFPKLRALFKKFGGFRLVVAYARIGVLGTAIWECIKGIVKRKEANEVFYAFEPKIVSALQEKYRPIMKKKLASNEGEDIRERSGIIWFCWLQGIENAPPIIKVCYQSLVDNIKNKEIIVIDDTNRFQFVKLPNYIERRRIEGQIPPAMFADILRLELLIKYGGTWIDATVFCSNSNYPREYLNSDLFFFQYSRPDERKYAGISNWFISACAKNPILMTLRDMLYAYWADFDCVLEYFIFHYFFDMLVEERPSLVLSMPYAYSPNSLVLRHHWDETFDQGRWDKLTSRVAFHKLAHQIDESVKEDKENYYNYILGKYGC